MNMSNAAVERLARLISDKDSYDDEQQQPQPRTRFFELNLGLAEGWFSLLLVAVVIYSTIWSVQMADWVDHLDILSLTTAIGLLLGFFAARQERFPRFAVYGFIVAFGILLAFWQTAGAFYQGSVSAFAQGIGDWIATGFSGNAASDNAVFLFLIVVLGFVLAIMSVWLVYRMHSPWLMVLANAVVLIINLNNLSDSFVIFLVIFLIAALLLLLRLNLYESVTRWKRLGLRYSEDLSWEVMQAGAFISIGVLIFSWILPNGYVNGTVSQAWNSNANPIVQVQNTWDSMFDLNSGANPTNHGNFRDTLTLGGNPNLNDDIVLTYKTTDQDPSSHYLAFVSYESYTNGNWALSYTDSGKIDANQALSPSATTTRAVKQTITIVNPPGEQNSYVLGASEINELSIPATVLFGNGGIVAWLGTHGNVPAGTTYTVTSTVSDADIPVLDSVPMPQNAPRYVPGNREDDQTIPVDAFSPTLVSNFTQWPQSVNKQRITALAQSIVAQAGAKTMYQQAVALETYLRTHYTYNVNIHPRPGEDPVTWFLFDNAQKSGFCNYFATSMALLARSLGIPARVIAGYAPGQYDAKNGRYVVKGKDAHSWTQIYFAGYGWINFEPSASFATFPRPQPDQSSALGSGASTTLPANVVPPGLQAAHLNNQNQGNANSRRSNAVQPEVVLRQDLSVALGGLILLFLFACIVVSIWWRRLFRHHSLAAQLYGRVCVLAQSAGLPMSAAQTPYESMHSLAESALSDEKDVIALERLGDIYVRERWAPPDSQEHPLHSGEINELPALWKRLQPRLFVYVLRHPAFLAVLPAQAWRTLVSRWRRWRVKTTGTA